MLHEHPDHPGRRIRLAYCLNLHPAEDLEQTIAGMRAITLPLRDRIARKGEIFGAGLYLPAALSRGLVSGAGARDLERLAAFVAENGLDPFTFNGFPAGGFHASGLKQSVFRPTWMEKERLTFTLDLARIAVRLVEATPAQARSHVSISTHTGAFGAWVRSEEDERACGENLARAAEELSRVEAASGVRIVLSLEAEPRAMSGNNAALARFLEKLPQLVEGKVSRSAIERHLGVCLDTCHSAVEFEDPSDAFARATSVGPLGKLQFSSALALADPASTEKARAELLALDEPRYLHQVNGAGNAGRCEVDDLGELRRALEGPERERWLGCREWRCHFHVPVDLVRWGESGLSTTREHAGAALRAALADPERWGVDELHLEIETYTWDVLPEIARGPARGSGALVDGLSREYAHVLGLLEDLGWSRSADRIG